MLPNRAKHHVWTVGLEVKGGRSSIKMDDSCGLLPVASWFGENPFIFFSEFIAFIAQTAAIS